MKNIINVQAVQVIQTIGNAMKPVVLSAITVGSICLGAVGVYNLIPGIVVQYLESIESEELIYIDQDTGAYKFKEEGLSQQIVDELQNKGIMCGILDLNADIIDKYIDTAIKTTYPKTDVDGNDVDGAIIIKRASATTETDTDDEDQTLEYKSYKDFNEIEDEEIFKYFTLNPDTLELCIARKGDSRTRTNIRGETTVEYEEGIVIDTIDYKEYVKNYSTPLYFFMILHIISQDVNYMQDVLDLMVPENETDELMVLTYVEKSIVDDTIYTYAGEDKSVLNDITELEKEEIERDNQKIRTVKENKKFLVEYSHAISNENVVNYAGYIENYNDINTNSDKLCKKISYVTNSGEIQLTKANTWIRTLEKSINFSANTVPGNIENATISSNEEILNYTASEYIKIKLTNVVDGKVFDYKKKINSIYINRDSNLEETNISAIINTNKDKLEVNEFVSLINKYPKVENKITTAPSYIFDLLSKNESTQILNQIMRYALFKVSGVDYEVNQSQLEYLLGIGEKSTSNSTLLKEYIRYWNKEYMSVETSADGKNYIIVEDSNGNLVVGYGIKVKDYKQRFIDNGYSTSLGGEVSREFVDELENEIITTLKEEVKGYVGNLNLTEYQINALVSRAYDFGSAYLAVRYNFNNDGNFYNIYKEYWNQENDDKRNSLGNADFQHELYKKYMSKSLGGSSSRRSSEWILFQTGYYDVLGKWQSPTHKIILMAHKIHKYMEENEYTYCVSGNNSLEECEENEAHGLNWTFEESKSETGKKHSCCATYVSWVLIESGYITRKQYIENAESLYNYLRYTLKWEVINVQDYGFKLLEPGDILCYKGHIDIYAGDKTKYNAGSGEAIRSNAPDKMGSTEGILFALRAR